MARTQRSGARGFGLTFTTEPIFPPDLSDVVDRLKKNKKVWEELRTELTADPSNFKKSSRFINDRMPVPGPTGKGVAPAANWYGGGYHGRLKLRPADKKVNITSSRPYVPFLTSEFLNRIADELAEWWMDAE